MTKQLVLPLLFAGFMWIHVQAAPAFHAELLSSFNSQGSFSSLDAVTLGNQLIFSLGSGVDKRLYRFDGQTANAINDPFAGNQPNLRTSTVLNGMLYYPGFDANGSVLYRTDGFSTQLVADVNPAPDAFQNILQMMSDGNYVFYRAVGPNGSELFRTDGTTTTEFDLRPGGANSFPDNFRLFNSQPLFDATDGNGKRMLYRINGGTPQAIGPWPSSGSVHTVQYGGNYYWSVDTKVYRYDGNTTTTLFAPAGFTDLNIDEVNSQFLVFSARDASTWSTYTWDGSTTRKVLNGDAFPLEPSVEPVDYFANTNGLFRVELTSATEVRGAPGDSLLTIDTGTVSHLGNALIFRSGGPFGFELYRVDGSDGTVATLIGDINPNGDAFELSTNRLKKVGNQLYFVASSGTELGLYKTDGFSITLLTTVAPQSSLQAFNVGDFPFAFFNSGNSPTVWMVSDGATVADLASYFSLSNDGSNANPGRMIEWNGNAYYFAPSGNIYLLSSVPEPASCVLLGGFISSLFFRVRSAKCTFFYSA
jgi:ELWxxDGT repeat protein